MRILLLGIVLFSCQDKVDPQDSASPKDSTLSQDSSSGGDTASGYTDTGDPSSDSDGDGFDAVGAGGDDCDDTNPDVHPGAPETWYDGIDSNCDGQSDYDADGDGYDSDLYGGEDCDDNDPTIAPGADEIAGDGLDQDCDGSDPLILYGDVSLSYADAAIPGERYGVYAGAAVDNAGDVNGDGKDDLLIGDHYRTHLFYGPVSGELDITSADFIFTPAPDEWVNAHGDALSGAGDLNGDGYADILIGSYGDVGTLRFDNTAYVFYGPVSGEHTAPAADAVIEGDDYQTLGVWVSGAGDINADGLDDVLVSSDQWATVENGIFLVHGPLSPTQLVTEVAAAHFEDGLIPAEAGDVNGDGFDDVLVGRSRTEYAAYLYYGPADGHYSDSDADVTFIREYSHLLGLSGGGDVDNDGHIDLLMGDPQYSGDQTGKAYLIYGPPDPGITYLADADASFLGHTQGDYTGQDLDLSGDIDGDDFDDVVIGAWGGEAEVDGEPFSSGRTYLIYGPAYGALVLHDDADAHLYGPTDTIFPSGAGFSLSSSGDFNADGLNDLLIGAPNYVLEEDDEGEFVGTVGAVYLVNGRER